MSPTPPPVVAQVLSTGDRLKSELDDLQTTANVGYAAENYRRLVDYRDIWPHLVHDAADALSSARPQADLLGGDIEKIHAIKPAERRLVRLKQLSGKYNPPQAPAAIRGFSIRMEVEMSNKGEVTFLNDTVAKWLRDNAERPDVPYRITNVRCNWDQREIVSVTDKGEQRSAGSKSSGGGRPPGGLGGGGGLPGKRDDPPSNRPPGPPGGGGVGGFGMGGGGGTPGRRERPKGRQAPPGAGIGGFAGRGEGAPPSPSNPPGGGQGRRQQGQGGFRSPGNSGSQADLSGLAPLPDRPSLYPIDSTYYVVPVTFDIEILTSPVAPDTDSSADAGSRGEGIGS